MSSCLLSTTNKRDWTPYPTQAAIQPSRRG